MKTYWPICKMIMEEIEENKRNRICNSIPIALIPKWQKESMRDSEWFIKRMLQILPKIQELESTWIPVDERLPKTSIDVIIAYRWESIIWYLENQVWYDSYSHEKLSGVTDWQPLPLPPTK